MNKMESMKIRKLVLTMSGPITISMLVQALYNIVDSIYVAKYSQDSLLAVSLCYPIQTIIVAVACGIGVGFNTVLSRSLGAKNHEKANKTVLHGILISLANWMIFAILGLLFSNWFLSFFSSNENIINMGSIYIRICTILSVGVFVQITYERIMQATGNSFYNMVIQSAGAIINIILDPIFIFGFNMGVAGAAIATVIGQISAMLLGIIIVQRKISEVKIRIRDFHYSGQILREIYRIGIPAMLMQSIMSFMTVFMNMILVQFSDMAISVFNIYYKLQQFIYMGVTGMTNALIPIVSFNVGANKMDRVYESISFTLKLSIFIMALGFVVFQLFPKQLLDLFSANASMYELGIPALRIISYSFIFAGICMVLCSAFQALNHANISLWVTLFRQMILLLPLTYILAKTFGLDIAWFAFVFTEISCSIFSIYFYKKKIKKSPIQYN